MLGPAHRLREPSQFAAVTRGRGQARSAGQLLVVHVAYTDTARARAPRVGFVVPKSVGHAVLRNRTKRRLRAQAAAVIGSIPPGVDVVVRATPQAADAPSRALGLELTAHLAKTLRRLAARGGS